MARRQVGAPPVAALFSGTTVSLEIPVLHKGGDSPLRKTDKGRHAHRHSHTDSSLHLTKMI